MRSVLMDWPRRAPSGPADVVGTDAGGGRDLADVEVVDTGSQNQIRVVTLSHV